MANISLKISLEGGKVVKTIQFDPSTTVYDACRIIREKILEATTSDPKEFGLFLASEEDNKKGIWLEASRSLDYYMLRNGDLLEYNKKTRNLRVRMLDGTVKTLLVDDSQIVANLMVVICTKIGITNYDEYGLVREEQREEPDPCEKPNYGTLTLKRKHHDKERDAKMDQLRKKLRTDDEVNWVEPAKTLREQGIDVSETLLLRRKLFFSDRNVDSRDPVQLNLLYVQARDAILDGTHPVTQDKACEFAGIQCQIQFGDHKEDKHTPGFLDLKEFLPSSYVKVKGIEKKVFREHRLHAGLSELDAKVLYTKSARDLSTYGVAFFLVKEKMKGKNKLVPRLLGVTKDSVLRLDEKTKEILQTWPLTTVRRWCASPNTFTLDFGDYSDQYYSVQTTEAEQILQVIAGYIDIIVRKRQASHHLGIDGDDNSAMLEDSVSPSRANIIQHDTFKSGKVNTESVAKPAVHRPGAEGARAFGVGAVSGAQLATLSGHAHTAHVPPNASQSQQTKVSSVLTEPQRALLSTITTGREVIRITEEELDIEKLPDVRQEASSVKWRQAALSTRRSALTGHIAAMNAATAQVVTLTAGPTEEVDHTAVGAAITTITTNLPEMTKGVKMMAALMDDGGDRLLDATRKLCGAFSELLKAAEPEAKEPRQSLLNAASRVGEASTTVLHTIGEETEEDKETQDILLSLAKAVANTTAALVLKAKNVAASCRDDQTLQNNIIAAATNCALATSQLVACAKVVAPTLASAECRSQVVGAAQAVGAAVAHLVSSAPTRAAAAHRLPEAAHSLMQQLDRLLDHCAIERGGRAERSGEWVQSVLAASERLAGAAGPSDMLRHARQLGQATAHLITNIKTEAESQPSEAQRKLLAAAKLLADATARMVEAARQCASSPQDREKQEALRRAAEEVKYITTDYAQGQDVTGTQLARLQESARTAASSATQLITAAINAQQHNTNKYSQDTLTQECESLRELVPRLVDSAHSSAAEPSAAAHLDLITTSESFLQWSGSALTAARAALPTLDASAARMLAHNTQTHAASTSDLRTAVNRTRVSCKSLELDAAEEIIRGLLAEVEEAERDGRELKQPEDMESEESQLNALRSSSRAALSSVSQVVAALRLGAPCGKPVAQLADALRTHTRTHRTISSTKQILCSSLTLVETVKQYVSNSEQVDIATVVSIAKDISEGIETTLEEASTHTELDEAMESISETLQVLNMGEFPPSDRAYGEIQSELNSAASELNSAASEVVAGVDERSRLVAAGAHCRLAHHRLLDVGLELAGRTENRETQTLMVRSLRAVTESSARLLGAARCARAAPAAARQLAPAATDVTDSINALMDVCASGAPGQKECEAAIRSIQASAALLSASAQPLSDLKYFDCLDRVIAESKGLSEGMSDMASAVKGGAGEQLSRGVAAVASAVCGLVAAAARAAHLVAVSDENSVPGRAGLVDQAQFARASEAIEQACKGLADPTTDQHQVLSAATVIAKHTSSLCNACRAASARCGDAPAKRHFVQAAKDVANSTANLVREIKALDTNYSEENRSRCASACGPLVEAVRGLRRFADSPEFAAVPARVSARGREKQEPLLQAARSIVSGSCSMLAAAGRLARGPRDRPHWQALAAHSRALSDSIKALVCSIRENAPGQKECSDALETITRLLRELDQASIQAVAQELEPRKANTLEGYCEQLENSASEMLELLEPLKVAAKGEAENLGHCVTQLATYATALVSSAVGGASLARASALQADLLGHARTALEASAGLLAAGHRRAEVESACAQCAGALSELCAVARRGSTGGGAVRPLLDHLDRARAALVAGRMSLIGSYDEADSFVDYQARMIGSAKEIARLATDMMAKSVTDPSQLVNIGNEMCQQYSKLAVDSVGAAASTANADVGNSIRGAVLELGEGVSELVAAAGRCRVAAGAHCQRAVADAARRANEKVVGVLSALQSWSRGTQACIDAAATIASIIGDLDTTILFASAGTLHSEKETDTFSDHRENILKTAKTLVEDTKTLVGGAAGSQDQLATAAHSAVNTVVQLCEVVKQGAMSLGSGSAEPQVLLLHAARAAAAALRDLAAATAAASGRPHHHPDMHALKHAAKRLGDHTKRWSLPSSTVPRQAKRRSLMPRLDYASNDSETDVFQSDQEEELLKLLDYSSQDDDVSPSVFYDNCVEIIAFIDKHLKNKTDGVVDDEKNERYNVAARNSLVDMDWRVMKYGENIFLGELKQLVNMVVEIGEKVENKRKIDVLFRLKANNDLDSEMKRLSQVIDDMDSVMEEKDTILAFDTVVPAKKAKIDDVPLTVPVFRVKKVKAVNLNKEILISSLSPEAKPELDNTNKSETNAKGVLWKMFNDDSELWKEIAKRNLKKMEETRLELERFSGHELVLGDYQSEKDKHEKEKATLQSFIDDVDKSKAVKMDLEYDKKYEDVILKLIEFAKKDFIYKGFDPLIEQLNLLSKFHIDERKNKVKIENVVNIYNDIDITRYTYEELCILEKYYKEIIRKYKTESRDKENRMPKHERSPSIEKESGRNSAPPSYNKNVILNMRSSQNITKNIDSYSNTTIRTTNSLERSKTKAQRSKNNVEIYDLTRTYPLEYYANNWWSIYEDILKNREEQFGSVDNWWKYYETILNGGDTVADLQEMQSLVQSRGRSRPKSRLEDQMKILNDMKSHQFVETEAVERCDDQSVMVTNVTSLLKTVKAVEDEHTRGTRALESTIEAISQEIEVLLSSSPPRGTATAEELVRSTRQVTAGSARIVAAGNSGRQEALTAASNLARKAVADLLPVCKAAAYTAESEEIRTRTVSAGAAAACSFRALLVAVLAGDKQQFPELSRRVAHAVADIIAVAETLKGPEWVDPEDPTVIAESELLGAAASIDAAARKLDALRPRKAVKEADESLNFDEMILEAAKSIIAATSALVRAASAAQRELIDQGVVARRPAASSDDGQWSEGLVSAARLVAAAAHALVEAANALVQGAATEQRLVSSARQVAASTAQLLVACKVKADPTAESTRRLQAGGAAVIRSTDGLVRAATAAVRCDDERSLVLNRRMVGGIAQEIDARSEVLRIEKELEEARGRLTAIRQAKYKLRSDNETDNDTDGPGYTSDTPATRFKSPTSSFVNTTYSPNSTYSHHAQNSTNLSQNVSNLSQSIYNTTDAINKSQTGYNQNQTGYDQSQTGFDQSQSTYEQTHSFNKSQTPKTPTSPGQSNGYSREEYQSNEKKYTVQSPTFSSFRPQEETPKQNYEGFTTRQNRTNDRTMIDHNASMDESVVVRSLRLPEVRVARLVSAKPDPPPRRASLLNYETRLYDTPRPVNEYKEEQRHFESSNYTKEQKFGYDAPKTPLSPKFNARELKFDDKSDIYSSLKKSTTPKPPFDGVGQTFSEHQVTTEAIPGGTKHSEFTVKSESYQSYPKTEFSKIESRSDVKSPFVTSTPSKQDLYPDFPKTSTDLIKAATPEFERTSPYGKEVHGYGGPNFMEETTTEVKEIPNGTQKITTTKIYSSSPVNITSTNTKYEPIKLEGIDELSKSFDNDSRYSTLDSRFNTLESKMSSDTSRSFMRPSEFQSSDYQATTSTTKVKSPAELNKEIDSIDKKFSKQTITSETIERKSVMTSSHKSESSSTVTKKFGNF